MPTCSVTGCGSSRQDKTKMYRFPMVDPRSENLRELSRRRQEAWLKAMNKSNIDPDSYKNMRVCAIHFFSGKSAALKDTTNPDWIPSINMAGNRNESVVESSYTQSLVLEYPELVVESSCTQSVELDSHEALGSLKVQDIEELQSTNTATQTDVRWIEGLVNLNAEDIDTVHKSIASQTEELDKLHESIASQTELVVAGLSGDVILAFEERIALLEGMLKVHEISLETFLNNDKKTKFFTGLSTYNTMKELFTVLEMFLPESPGKFQVFYVVLTRLRLNLSFKYLAFKFSVSLQTISKYFHDALFIMFSKLRSLVYWPSRDSIKKTMPLCFQRKFGKRITVVIDCFDVLIQRPSTLKAQAQTWSNYKHANTVKYLIGITPQGMINFIAEGFGGRASDQYVTENSGFLDHLEEEDVVMADRGFLVADAIKARGVELNIPAFTKGKDQLHPLELESTRDTANVRIHVERIIGCLKLKFTILAQRKFPLHFLTKSSKCNISVLDQIVTLCCALVNLCGPICVKEKQDE